MLTRKNIMKKTNKQTNKIPSFSLSHIHTQYIYIYIYIYISLDADIEVAIRGCMNDIAIR